MSLVLSTEAVRPQERLSYWIDAVCRTYAHIDCSVPALGRIMGGSIDVQDLDLIELTISRSHPQSVHRTSQNIARHGSDHFLLQMPAFGACVVEQNGRRAILNPGDFALYDCTRSFNIHFFEDFEVRALKIPRSLLQAQVPAVEHLTAMRIAAECGAGSLIRTIFDQIYDLGTPITTTRRATASLSDALVSIVAAGLWTLSASSASTLPHMAGFHFERALQYVRGNLGNPSLSPSMVAAALGLSPSSLHRIFKQQPMSLMKFIWNCRLERCQKELVHPRHGHRSISEIAFAAGFSDVAHFSRTFRKAYGLSPREWRLSGA